MVISSTLRASMCRRTLQAAWIPADGEVCTGKCELCSRLCSVGQGLQQWWRGWGGISFMAESCSRLGPTTVQSVEVKLPEVRTEVLKSCSLLSGNEGEQMVCFE